MKKFVIIICSFITALLAFTLVGCNVKEPKVWVSQDNPNVMICDGLVPKPDKITVYNNSKSEVIEQSTNEFNNFWSAVNNLFNGKVKIEYLDGILSSDNISYEKRTLKCFEFVYNGIYQVENKGNMFNGMFFSFQENNLVFGYYTVNESGEYNSDIIEGQETKFYSATYGISVSKYRSKINKISKLIDL